MTKPSAETGLRKAAEAEAGMFISAGARVAHVRLALEAARSVVVNLSEIPAEQRPALVAEINQLVDRAVLAAKPQASPVEPPHLPVHVESPR